MNENFANYSTGVAFNVQLTKIQCNALLELLSFEEKRTDDPFHMVVHTVGTLQSLEARGLVEWDYDLSGKARHFKGLTKAGKLMAGLLQEAGLTIQNTTTVSVLKRKLSRAA